MDHWLAVWVDCVCMCACMSVWLADSWLWSCRRWITWQLAFWSSVWAGMSSLSYADPPPAHSDTHTHALPLHGGTATTVTFSVSSSFGTSFAPPPLFLPLKQWNGIKLEEEEVHI